MPEASWPVPRSRASLDGHPADGAAARPGTGTGGGVLADRIAAGLVNHDPGWRLPRFSELARRYNASSGEIRAAVDYLIARLLVRRAPDGRLYRSGPAEYLVSLEGMAGPGVTVDPMGGDLTCLSCGVSRRPAAQDAARALRLQPGTVVGVLRLAWALNGAPAAISTTYLAGRMAEPQALPSWLKAAAEHGGLPLPPLAEDSTGHSPGHLPDRVPCAVTIQMEPPPVAVARRLRLAPGEMAVLVTVVFADTGECGPAALTAVVLRPGMFRIIVGTPAPEADRPRPRAAWPLAEDGEEM